MYEISSFKPIFKKNEELKIPRIDVTNSYEYFFNNFMLPNKPCIISNVSKDWQASKCWVTENNKPNISYLFEKYKDHEACISNCGERYFNAQKTQNFTFNDYVEYWQRYLNSNYSEEYPLLYLKDWHLRKISGDDFYTVPLFFASDWLNEYFSEKTDDDYMFVYMGPKGTWTPFHVDVFTSFSWSTNICGKKKWLFFSPGEEENLKDSFSNLPYDVTNYKNKVNHIEIVQNSGDAIFVPSGWHHQVWNLDDTISINHNWVNGCNIKTMWLSIVDNLNAVKKEIFDCRDSENWTNQCQIVLKASHGIDFYIFYNFLHYIAINRLEVLKNNAKKKQFSGWMIGENHARFDLLKIREVLELFVLHEDFNEMKFVQDLSLNEPQVLLNILREFLFE